MFFPVSIFMTFLICSTFLLIIKAEVYPDYEFNQRLNENSKKISPKNHGNNKNFNKNNHAKNENEKYNYNTKNALNNINGNEDERDDDIIVTKPVSCFEPSGGRPPNCDYMADQGNQKENLIHPSMRIEKRQSSDDYEDEGDEEDENESNSGYGDKGNDDEEDDEDDDEDEEEEDEDDDRDGRIIDGRFRENEKAKYGRTTHRMPKASNPIHSSSNNLSPYHNNHNNIKQQHNMRHMSTLSNHAQASQPPYHNYNQPNYARTNHDVSSAYNKDRQYQQLTAKMNILLIAGIAAGIVVLLFILVLAACKFYTSSTGATGAKALNDYQRSANKTAYAYEACNTGAKCSSPLLVPTSQHSLTPLNANSQAGLTNVGSSATNTATKPAKKDVKEWYV